jgi:branched-chain amino acid transport system permease protein
VIAREGMEPKGIQWLRTIWVPVSLIVLMGIIAVIGGFLSAELQYVVTEGFVYLVVVVGLYTFIGLSGVVSFGHISFMGVGAYAVSIPVILRQTLLPALPHWLAHMQLGLVLSALAGGIVAAVFALIIMFPIMRISGLAASITMFAVLIVTYVVESHWTQVTRGTLTMLGIPTDLTRGAAFAAGAVAVCAAWGFERSSAGVRLKAVREDEFAARSVGISVVRARSYAFLLSALLVGIGGALYGHLVGAFSPGDFYLDTTFLTIVMLVVGGTRSLTGAVVGTVLISALQEALNHVESGINLGLFHIPARPGLTQVGLAVVMLLILMFRPSGITRGRDIPFPRRASGDAEPADQEARATEAEVAQDLAHEPTP